MEKLELDTLGVYAYADSSHVRDRELWRGFLSYSLPVLLGINSELIDKYIAESIVYHFDELTACGGLNRPQQEVIRCISTLLAKEINVCSEFALAAFFEGELPTKLMKVNLKSKKKNTRSNGEDAVIAGWLNDLSRLQNENKFINQVELWKSWIHLDQNLEKAI